MSHRSTFATPGALASILAAMPFLPLLPLLPAACAHGATSPGFAPVTFDAAALLDEAGLGDDGGPFSQPMPKSYLRFADWAPDALPGFDICVAPHGSGSLGGSDPDASDESEAGAGTGTSAAGTIGPLLGQVVAFPGVSQYVTIPPGTYDVSIISQAAKTCADSAVPVVALPPLAEGARATVAIIGDLVPIGTDRHAQGIAFADDVTGHQGKAAVRFLDAMPGASTVVFGLGSIVTAMFMPLTSAAVSGGPPAAPAMNGPAADANGYLLLDPLRGGSISAQSAGAGPGDVFVGSSTTYSFDGGFPAAGQPTVYAGENDVATGSNANWVAGSIVTVALIDGNWGTTPQLMVCQDNAAPVGSPSSCTVLMP